MPNNGEVTPRAEAASHYPTRRCPQCGQELFADMDVCFGCLHSFDEAPEPPDSWDEDVVPTDAYGLDPVADASPHDRFYQGRYGLRLHTDSVDVTIPLMPGGVVVGRGTSCDVMLRERAVSRQHVRIDLQDGHVTATDLGATNRATLRGSPIEQGTALEPNDVLKVCRSTITLVDLTATE